MEVAIGVVSGAVLAAGADVVGADIDGVAVCTLGDSREEGLGLFLAKSEIDALALPDAPPMFGLVALDRERVGAVGHLVLGHRGDVAAIAGGLAIAVAFALLPI